MKHNSQHTAFIEGSARTWAVGDGKLRKREKGKKQKKRLTILANCRRRDESTSGALSGGGGLFLVHIRFGAVSEFSVGMLLRKESL